MKRETNRKGDSMGDRALVAFTDGTDVSPVTYVHWTGSEVRQDLEALRQQMEPRGSDVAYASARFTGRVVIRNGGNEKALSVGTWNFPIDSLGDPDIQKFTSREYSHGDQGAFLVDLQTWKATLTGGSVEQIGEETKGKEE